MSEPKTGKPGLPSFDLHGDLMPEPVGLGPLDADLSDGIAAQSGEDVLSSGAAQTDESLTRIAPTTGVCASELDGDAIVEDDAVLLGDDDLQGTDDDQLVGAGDGDVILGEAGAAVSDDEDGTDAGPLLYAVPETERDGEGFNASEALPAAWITERELAETRRTKRRGLSFVPGVLSV